MPFQRQGVRPVGRGDLGISGDNIVLIVQLIVQAARRTRRRLYASGVAFDENKITIELHKEIVRIIRRRGFYHLAFMLEASLNNPDGELGKVDGRIDLQVVFAEWLRPEEYYFGVECKRLRPGDSGTFRYYVDAGVGKFADGTYAPGHPAGMLVGYLMANAEGAVTDELSRRVSSKYPGAVTLNGWPDKSYRDADIVAGDVPRAAGQPINILHTVVRMHG
ncbi:hypothetical protein [Methylorubrum sp. SB2]|uniref:hypothetical protein n=1 Tax=Methylorubrum subtropicum TaxID=3138812 RepID=UPI00313E19AD